MKYSYPLLLVVFWLFILGNIFVATIPIPNNKSFKSKTTIFSFIPQGWGFFTRDPREDIINVYERRNDKIIKVTKTNSSVESYFGISRKNRLKNIELGIITSQIKNEHWAVGAKSNFSLTDIATDTITHNFKPQNFFGEYYLVKQERIPWAWSKNYKNLVMPYKYVKIYVK
ncbi:MAG: SdpA family antimicrobial peptide system protein [Urechidicola sp.]|nr:SdpA family antimicrobial peptide system protein [Urechidicola sp.]